MRKQKPIKRGIFAMLALTTLATFLILPFALMGGRPASAKPQTGVQHYAAPDGSPGGDGSITRPWDLQTVLSQPGSVRPGDIIWMRGGQYYGEYTSRLTGNESAPIIVRQYPGERATIVRTSVAETGTVNILTIYGSYTWYWGFEVMNSNPKRVTTTPGSHPPDLERGDGVTLDGNHVKLINLIVHDGAESVGFWTPAVDSEVYGSLLFNGGWLGPDRGHGHAIYIQNDTGVKRVVDNILFDQFGYGVHAYGVEGQLKGMYFEGNTLFNNGAPTSLDNARNMLIGGEHLPAENITLTNNYFYLSPHRRSDDTRFGYAAPTDRDITLTNNYFVGGDAVSLMYEWQNMIVTGNTFYGPGLLIDLKARGGNPALYQWDNNSYFASANRALPLSFRDRSYDFRGWQAASGFDRNSRFTNGRPQGVQVFVRPNRYEPGRANIIVYNWNLETRVNVDVSNVLTVGTPYEVRNAQDFFGGPVLTGVYDGQPLSLLMTGLRTVPPIGNPPVVPPPTGPEFNAFVLLPVNLSSVGTATPFATSTRFPTLTITPTRTNTITPSPTRTLVPTKTNTPTRIPSPTRTVTPTRTITQTRTPTRTASVTRTATLTRTVTPTGTITPDVTNTPTPTSTSTPTGPVVTSTPTNTPGTPGTPSPAPTSCQAVEWTSLVNVVATGNTIQKPSEALSGWNAGAVSSLSIRSGDGYVQATIDALNTLRMFGLGNGNDSVHYRDIEFAAYLDDDTLRVYESGLYKATDGTMAVGDTVRVAVEGGHVKYYHNDRLFYTSTVMPRYPLLLDTALHTPGGRIADALICGVDISP